MTARPPRRASGLPGRLLPGRILLGLLLLGLLLLGLPAGCSEVYTLDELGGTAQVSNCLTDPDCGAGLVCEQGLCTVDTVPAARVALCLTPPPSTGLLPQQWTGVRVGAGRRIPDIRLRPTVTLTGRIADPSNPLAASIPARVVATMQGTIPGTSLGASATAANGTGFTITLVRDSTYSISIVPLNTSLPPLILGAVALTEDAAQDIQLPRAAERIALRGRVVLSAAETGGVPDVRVQAFSEDLSRISTTSVTDAAGLFEIFLPPGESPVTLRLSATAEHPTLPTVDHPAIQPTAAGLPLGEFPLGSLERPVAEAPATMRGLLLDAAGEPLVSGATLEFSAPVGLGSFHTRIWFDLTGSFEVQLPPAVFSLTAIPAPESQAGLTRFDSLTVPVGGASFGELRLLDKSPLAGRVLSGASADARLPVPDVQVEASLVSDPAAGSLEGIQRVTRQVSQADGTFELHLDPGIVDLTFIPLAATGLPRWVERAIRTDGPLERDFHLREPQVVHGIVRGPTGSPASGVQIEVYQVEEATTTLLGSATTDEEGAYLLVLPFPS